MNKFIYVFGGYHDSMYGCEESDDSEEEGLPMHPVARKEMITRKQVGQKLSKYANSDFV